MRVILKSSRYLRYFSGSEVTVMWIIPFLVPQKILIKNSFAFFTINNSYFERTCIHVKVVFKGENYSYRGGIDPPCAAHCSELIIPSPLLGSLLFLENLPNSLPFPSAPALLLLSVASPLTPRLALNSVAHVGLKLAVLQPLEYMSLTVCF